MYLEVLQNLGLAQNEARIYETLLKLGESSVGTISTDAKVHRRNVYDSLNRLIEKGLVFEIIQKNENRYQAVDPKKLSEVLQEKQKNLDKVMPELEKLYQGTPHKEEVYIYRGIEGFKNYMRDILRIGKDIHVIGAKAQLNSPSLRSFLPYFKDECKKQGITVFNLYDAELRDTEHIGFLDETYKFLPEGYSSPSTVSILDDRVFFFSGISVGNFREDVAFTVIINPEIAEAHRAWFRRMWDCAE